MAVSINGIRLTARYHPRKVGPSRERLQSESRRNEAGVTAGGCRPTSGARRASIEVEADRGPQLRRCSGLTETKAPVAPLGRQPPAVVTADDEASPPPTPWPAETLLACTASSIAMRRYSRRRVQDELGTNPNPLRGSVIRARSPALSVF